jgi:diguanylate cyclase (GGDEF)-like protein
MAELLMIPLEELKAEFDKRFEANQPVNSMDVFECFVSTVAASTNVLSEDQLRGLVFRQFRSYSDFDESMNAIAESVSGIHQSTKEAISAIDKNDSGALKSVYEQLKSYQERIKELEDDMYTDDLTGLMTRKHLMNRELATNEKFKNSGMLLEVSISNFGQINNEHGHVAGDVILKFVAKTLQKNLKKANVNLIRYLGVQFVALCRTELAVKADKIVDETIEVLMSKTFKTHEGEKLNVELNKASASYDRGQSFKGVYESL